MRLASEPDGTETTSNREEQTSTAAQRPRLTLLARRWPYLAGIRATPDCCDGYDGRWNKRLEMYLWTGLFARHGGRDHSVIDVLKRGC